MHSLIPATLLGLALLLAWPLIPLALIWYALYRLFSMKGQV